MITQQAVLLDAMRTLNLTHEAFAERIGVGRQALDAWLLPVDSGESRVMPEMVGSFVSEILLNQLQKKPSRADISTQSLVQRISLEGQPHLLSVSQIDRDSLEEIFHLSDVMQPIARRRKISRVLEGAVLGSLFFEASTRTRVSFGAAFCRLGGSVCDTTGFTFSSMAKGESIYDTSRVMAGYVDALVVRHPEQGSVAEFARATNIPLMNAGDGPGEHPTQAILDIYTLQREFSRLGKQIDGSHVALVGDLKYGRTVHSLIRLLAMYRSLKFTLVSPPSLEMPAHLIELVSRNGHVVEQTTSVVDGLRGADMVYATRIQKERFSGEETEGYSPAFQIRKELVDSVCKPDTVLMHPLPRDGRIGANDLSTDLNHDPRLAIFRQTDNGIPVRMALFAILMGVDGQVSRSMRDPLWSAPFQVGPDDAGFDALD